MTGQPSAATDKVCPDGAVSRVVHRKAEEEAVAEPTAEIPGPRGKSELARSFRGWGDNAARCRSGRRDGAKIGGRGTGAPPAVFGPGAGPGDRRRRLPFTVNPKRSVRHHA
ncbi:hypothetical protein Mam01_67540 [Microbispora amethystogenes]|uniref:Uncharacterized protein n=1 Tax=Microbispora amethystogenes TaxID=1427754 RepID=A0ABQ4FP51_9ACTN|nr:hypothetical protein Mam01_67540 [Microbispora amethystogenes]